MRLTSTSSLLRTFYAVSSARVLVNAAAQPQNAHALATAARAPLRPFTSSMPVPFLSSLFSSSASPKHDMSKYPVQKSEGEWQAQLSPEQFRVLRKQGTEAPYTGKYNDFKKERHQGVFTCAGCNAPLYTSDTKFESHCGWPAFYDTVPGAVERIEDRTLGMTRTEIRCTKCGGHLGHVFKGEKFGNPIDERHCVNSVSLNFTPEGTQGGAKEPKN